MSTDLPILDNTISRPSASSQVHAAPGSDDGDSPGDYPLASLVDRRCWSSKMGYILKHNSGKIYLADGIDTYAILNR